MLNKPPDRQNQTLTVAEVILEQLRLWGVNRIYGVVGNAIFGLADAIAKQNAIQFISVKHESIAALMASAEAKLTGKLAVCAAHMGPGITNLMNGLGDAFMDHAPVLAISGQAPLNKIGTNYKQYIDQQKLVQVFSAFNQLVVHPDAVGQSLKQAMHIAISQETVAHLSIPSDLFTMPTTKGPLEQSQISPPVSTQEPIQQALQRMRSAKQPMLLIGRGAHSAGKEIQQLAEKWGCGIALSYGDLGIIPHSAQHVLGGLGEGGNPYLTGLFRKADVVAAIGTSWWPEEVVPAQTRLIRIEKDATKFAVGPPAEIGIHGDVVHAVSQLLEGMRQYAFNPDWIGQLSHCRQAWLEQNEKECTSVGTPIPPSRIIRAIENAISDDAVIALDEGDSTLWFLRNFQAKRQQVLLSTEWRTMGFGLPAAMAAKLCMPQKQVICITGDGGIEMVLADLLTAVRYRLSICVIVFNNGTLQLERDKMHMKGLYPAETRLTNPNFALAAEACGWDAYRIDHAEHLEEVLIKYKDSDKPVLLDVPTAQEPFPDFRR